MADDVVLVEMMAASERDAALNLGVRKAGLANVDAQMNGLGVFISADGLAFVDLSTIAFQRKPIVVTTDGTELPFGTILGIFPDHELALRSSIIVPKPGCPSRRRNPNWVRPSR